MSSPIPPGVPQASLVQVGFAGTFRRSGLMRLTSFLAGKAHHVAVPQNVGLAMMEPVTCSFCWIRWDRQMKSGGSSPSSKSGPMQEDQHVKANTKMK